MHDAPVSLFYTKQWHLRLLPKAHLHPAAAAAASSRSPTAPPPASSLELELKPSRRAPLMVLTGLLDRRICLAEAA
jgi:hypothetical protein